MGSTTLCCLEEEFCCKQGADPLCLYCCACRIVPVSVLIKGQAQTCCCVTGVAIPPDAEVPCMIGTLGIVCYPSFDKNKDKILSVSETREVMNGWGEFMSKEKVGKTIGPADTIYEEFKKLLKHEDKFKKTFDIIIKTGSLESAEVIILDPLTMRADRDRK